MSTEIVKSVEGSKGQYLLATPNGDAIMTFSVMSPTMIIVDHTEVPEGAEGQGYAAALARNLVADAQESGFKIVPLCPFVNGWRRRHPEAPDVFNV